MAYRYLLIFLIPIFLIPFLFKRLAFFNLVLLGLDFGYFRFLYSLLDGFQFFVAAARFLGIFSRLIYFLCGFDYFEWVDCSEGCSYYSPEGMVCPNPLYVFVWVNSIARPVFSSSASRWLSLIDYIYKLSILHICFAHCPRGRELLNQVSNEL